MLLDETPSVFFIAEDILTGPDTLLHVEEDPPVWLVEVHADRLARVNAINRTVNRLTLVPNLSVDAQRFVQRRLQDNDAIVRSDHLPGYVQAKFENHLTLGRIYQINDYVFIQALDAQNEEVNAVLPLLNYEERVRYVNDPALSDEVRLELYRLYLPSFYPRFRELIEANRAVNQWAWLRVTISWLRANTFTLAGWLAAVVQTVRFNRQYEAWRSENAALRGENEARIDIAHRRERALQTGENIININRQPQQRPGALANFKEIPTNKQSKK